MTSVVHSELYSGEDSGWQEAGSSGTEVLLVAFVMGRFWCRLLDLGAEASSPLGVLLGGCVGVVVPLGDCPRAGPWLEVVLGQCVGPEGPWEGPEEVVEGRARCCLGAWGWLEELARDRSPPRGLPGSCVLAAVVAATA